MAKGDSELVQLAREGDRASFSEIVRRHRSRVYGTALHITGSHSDAEDIAQEAFVRAYRGLDKFDGRSELFTWLYRITVNTALNQLRSQGRQRKLARAGAERVAHFGGRPEAPGSHVLDPEGGALLTERTRRVFAAMEDLSETLRVTLVLATVESLPYKQIAEILEIPEGTVAWRVNEARKQLREKLAASPAVQGKGSDEQAI